LLSKVALALIEIAPCSDLNLAEIARPSPRFHVKIDLNLPWRLQLADCATLISIAASACSAHTLLASSPPYIPALTRVDEEIDLVIVRVVRRFDIGSEDSGGCESVALLLRR
jgi:hypothetical protein